MSVLVGSHVMMMMNGSSEADCLPRVADRGVRGRREVRGCRVMAFPAEVGQEQETGMFGYIRSWLWVSPWRVPGSCGRAKIYVGTLVHYTIDSVDGTIGRGQGWSANIEYRTLTD